MRRVLLFYLHGLLAVTAVFAKPLPENPQPARPEPFAVSLSYRSDIGIPNYGRIPLHQPPRETQLVDSAAQLSESTASIAIARWSFATPNAALAESGDPFDPVIALAETHQLSRSSSPSSTVAAVDKAARRSVLVAAVDVGNVDEDARRIVDMARQNSNIWLVILYPSSNSSGATSTAARRVQHADAFPEYPLSPPPSLPNAEEWHQSRKYPVVNPSDSAMRRLFEATFDPDVNQRGVSVAIIDHSTGTLLQRIIAGHIADVDQRNKHSQSNSNDNDSNNNNDSNENINSQSVSVVAIPTVKLTFRSLEQQSTGADGTDARWRLLQLADLTWWQLMVGWQLILFGAGFACIIWMWRASTNRTQRKSNFKRSA